MNAATLRLSFIDALKAIASQLIVLHHLAFYGPMSDSAEMLFPELIEWLSQHARIAVQVFLVIGGFLAAKGLAPDGKLLGGTPQALLFKRYRKLITPFIAALLLAIAGAALARLWMEHDSIPLAPRAVQFLAHTLLLHNLLDYDALSAGVWYVAIDFQLFALLLGVLWLARSKGDGRSAGLCLVIALGLASLFHFNRDAEWDNWGIYFFGSYALGVLTYWVSSRERSTLWLMLIALVVVAALIVDFRIRIGLALIVALALGIAQRSTLLCHWPQIRLLSWLGRISYSVFLVHFPVCLVINAAFSRFAPDEPEIQAFGMLFAWLCAIGAGALFHRFVESRARQWEERVSTWTLLPLRRLFQ